MIKKWGRPIFPGIDEKRRPLRPVLFLFIINKALFYF
jgi:hypothetical protein